MTYLCIANAFFSTGFLSNLCITQYLKIVNYWNKPSGMRIKRVRIVPDFYCLSDEPDFTIIPGSESVKTV